MTIDLIKQTLKYTIFLGLIGLFVMYAFKLHGTFVDTRVINGQTIYTFNWYTYINNLNNAWTTTTLSFEEILPSREYIDLNDIGFDPLDEDYWGAIYNNIALTFDWIYFPINIILWLIRWLAWVFKLVLALIGWDFTKDPGLYTYNSGLVNALTWIVNELMIPYL